MAEIIYNEHDVLLATFELRTCSIQGALRNKKSVTFKEIRTNWCADPLDAILMNTESPNIGDIIVEFNKVLQELDTLCFVHADTADIECNLVSKAPVIAVYSCEEDIGKEPLFFVVFTKNKYAISSVKTVYTSVENKLERDLGENSKDVETLSEPESENNGW